MEQDYLKSRELPVRGTLLQFLPRELRQELESMRSHCTYEVEVDDKSFLYRGVKKEIVVLYIFSEDGSELELHFEKSNKQRRDSLYQFIDSITKHRLAQLPLTNYRSQYGGFILEDILLSYNPRLDKIFIAKRNGRYELPVCTSLVEALIEIYNSH
jgi:hypothetical protein